VFFSSDRNGGCGLWSVDVTLGGAVSALTSITDDAASETTPSPLNAAGAMWLLFRSDSNVPLTQAGSAHIPRSRRTPDNGALRRYAGSVSINPRDAARIETRRLFGDMLCYTPNRPDGGALSNDELYTRGTIGLYVSRAKQGSALTEQEALRLRELLRQFQPVNLRAVVIVVAPADVEFVYLPGSDIQESYHDVYPFAEALGPVNDNTTAAMPELLILRSNAAANVSANPADLTTLRRRTFFPPLR
jgi:hypothetical protein